MNKTYKEKLKEYRDIVTTLNQMQSKSQELKTRGIFLEGYLSSIEEVEGIDRGEALKELKDKKAKKK